MKTLLPIACSLLLCTIVLAADADSKSDAKSEVKNAAKKLADQPNYSWVSKPDIEGVANVRLGPTQGQTEKGGITYLKMSYNDLSPEAAIKGDKAAIKIDYTWQSTDELEDNQAWVARWLKSFKTPAAEAEHLVEKSKSLKKVDGVISGEITDEAIKEQLTIGRRTPEVKGGKGSVKFWINNGELSKYEVTALGRIVGRDGDEREVARTTTVEIKDVGKTKVAAPEDAKKKL